MKVATCHLCNLGKDFEKSGTCDCPGLSDVPALISLFSSDYCRWAVSSVMTRQNQIPTEDGSRVTLALIPLWDMCNHTSGLVSTHCPGRVWLERGGLPQVTLPTALPGSYSRDGVGCLRSLSSTSPPRPPLPEEQTEPNLPPALPALSRG